jgi:hypothetical protein
MNAMVGNKNALVGVFMAFLPALALCGCVTVEETPRSHWNTAAPTPPAVSPEPSDLSAMTDPTVNHLHDLGGSLLLYYMMHRQLPERLDEVESIAGRPAGIDPATRKPFLYWSDPPKVEGQPGWLVVCQAAATKGASRWALFINNDQSANGALVTGVRLVSDAMLAPVLAPAPEEVPPPTTAPAQTPPPPPR